MAIAQVSRDNVCSSNYLKQVFTFTHTHRSDKEQGGHRHFSLQVQFSKVLPCLITIRINSHMIESINKVSVI